MIFVKNSLGGREVNMMNTLSKNNLSKIGWEGGGSTSIWIMSVNILFFFWTLPLIFFNISIEIFSAEMLECVFNLNALFVITVILT